MIAPAKAPLAPATRQLPDHISPSAAKSYLSCSLKFFFERVLRLPSPVSPSLHLGKAIHAGLQAYHLARWRGGNDSPESVAAVFEVEFRRLEEDEGPVSWKDAKARDKARQDGLRVLAAYLDSDEAEKGKPRAVEVPLDQQVDGLPVPLGGVIDLVNERGVPVDFKSAAARPDPKQAAFDHEIQLVSYQLLVEGATGETPPSLDLVFLVKTKTPQVFRISSPPADAIRKSRVIGLLRLAVEGIADGRFHPQPGMHCSWCPYRAECAAWPHGIRAAA